MSVLKRLLHAARAVITTTIQCFDAHVFRLTCGLPPIVKAFDLDQIGTVGIAILVWVSFM
jgi:hypothetical protein